ncbi:MAG: hypothetical protein PHY02_01870 [Phycisphaerae bacterium]|nr:hypothetical protein [Phycisphaerae bacterium]
MGTGKRRKKEVFVVIAGVILLWATGSLARTYAGPGRMGMCRTTFTEKASGGTLIMWDNLNRNAPYVVIETVAGESAETAIARLANVIEETNPFHWGITPMSARKFKERIVTSSGGELQGLVGSCGSYLFAGTETGLGIPRPPHSLTANYDPKLKKIALKWLNPPGGYDEIRIVFNWSNYDHAGGDGLAGDAESYVIDLDKIPANTGDLDILVFGIRNDIPSNAAAIHINNNIQEELYGFPFSSGLAPNWQRWSLDANEAGIKPQMGIRNELTDVKGRRYNSIETADKKPFYQIIESSVQGGTGGVYRKFIGLTPGHTYRVKARMAALSELKGKKQSVSVHASAGCALSPRQMAGLDALPCGKKGSAACKLKNADSKTITKGKYGEYSDDITLPQDSNSITVWLRYTGKGAGSVGLDWISLEDLSAKTK